MSGSCSTFLTTEVISWGIFCKYGQNNLTSKFSELVSASNFLKIKSKN